MLDILKPRRTVALGATAVLVGIAAAAVWLFWSEDPAASVTLREGDYVVATVSLDDALEEASGKAGFEVVAPRKAPAGYAVKDILVHSQPERPPGAPPTDFRLVTTRLESGPDAFTFDQLRGAFDPALSGEAIQNTLPGAEVYYLETKTAVVYSMIVKGRGFVVWFDPSRALTRSDALKLLESIAEEVP